MIFFCKSGVNVDLIRLIMDNLENILFLIGIIVYIIYLDRRTKKRRKNLDKIAKENPKLYEKVEIEKSKVSSDVKRDLEITKKSLIVRVVALIFIVLGVFLLIRLMNKYSLNSDIVTNISILILISLMATFIIVGKYNKNKVIKIIFTCLQSKYGVVEKLKTPSPVIVEGNIFEVGNIRHKYLFSYKIGKYNCVLSNYYREVLCKYREYDHNRIREHVRYRYERRANIMDYCYNLKYLGLDNINNDILLQPDVKKIIENLSETKYIKVSIKEGCLLIEKETVLKNYNSEDAFRDASDVELFYNKLVKVIMKK